jgi:hypothetical protein
MLFRKVNLAEWLLKIDPLACPAQKIYHRKVRGPTFHLHISLGLSSHLEPDAVHNLDLVLIIYNSPIFNNFPLLLLSK